MALLCLGAPFLLQVSAPKHFLVSLLLSRCANHCYSAIPTFNFIFECFYLTKEKIEKSTCREANKLFIDHMIANCTISTVGHFAQLLIDTSDKLANEVHKGIGEELVGAIEKQRKMVEHMTSSVTPSLSSF